MSFFAGAKERIKQMLPDHGGEDANVKAFGMGFIIIVLLIIGVIALFLDIVFVTMIWDALPGGFLRIIAAAGAILVSPVVMLVLLAKLFYFRKGGQMIFAFILFAIDMGFAILNTYCAFQIAWHNENDFVVTWRNLSPLTPVVLLALLSILLMIDPNAARRNKIREHQEKMRDLEMQAELEAKARKMALQQMQAEFQTAQEEAKIQVQMDMLEEYKKILMEEMANNPQAKATLREGARRLTEDEVHGMTGLPRGFALPPAKEVTGELVSMPKDSTNVPLCSTHNIPAASQVRGVWYCAECLTTMAEHHMSNTLRETSPLAPAPSSSNGHQNGA